MLTRLTLSILATLAPLAARAAESTHCDRAALARAEAAAYTSTRVQHECLDPRECSIADELVAASLAQLSAVRRLCEVPAVSTADPFEEEAEVDDSDPGAWLAVQDATAEATERFESAVRP